jgi:DNA-binding NtrC family response regulator
MGPEKRNVDHSGVAAEAGHAGPTAPFVLIIDDQEGVCSLVAAALAGFGVESAIYPTAKPAIVSLDRRRPDAVFLDVALEQSDAIDVIKGLSEKHYTGIVQLMSGGRLPLLEAIQRIGTRYGLVLLPALQKPLRDDDLRRAIVGAGLVKSL